MTSWSSRKCENEDGVAVSVTSSPILYVPPPETCPSPVVVTVIFIYYGLNSGSNIQHQDVIRIVENRNASKLSNELHYLMLCRYGLKDGDPTIFIGINWLGWVVEFDWKRRLDRSTNSGSA